MEMGKESPHGGQRVVQLVTIVVHPWWRRRSTVERRVQQATNDLRRERDELRAQLQGGRPAEGEAIAVEMAKMLLEELILRPDVAAHFAETCSESCVSSKNTS